MISISPDTSSTTRLTRITISIGLLFKLSADTSYTLIVTFSVLSVSNAVYTAKLSANSILPLPSGTINTRWPPSLRGSNSSSSLPSDCTSSTLLVSTGTLAAAKGLTITGMLNCAVDLSGCWAITVTIASPPATPVIV